MWDEPPTDDDAALLEQRSRPFDSLLKTAQEPGSHGAVDDLVVDRQAHGGHLSHHHLSSPHDGLLDGPAHAEDRTLPSIQYRREAVDGPENADGKGAVGDLVRG